jgi:hypothetical protein
MVIFTLYLPGTAANVQHQHAAIRGVCTDQKNRLAITGTVRRQLLESLGPRLESCAEPDTRCNRNCSFRAMYPLRSFSHGQKGDSRPPARRVFTRQYRRN